MATTMLLIVWDLNIETDKNLKKLISFLGLIGSVILILNPVLAGISLVVITAVAFIFSGISAIILAFNLKKLKNYPNKISKELKDKIESLKNEYHNELNK